MDDHLNFKLPPKYTELVETTIELLRDAAPVLEGADEHSYFPEDLLKVFRDSKLAELMVVEQHGGRFPEIDPLAVCVIRETLMQHAATGHMDALFSLQGIGSYAISLAGTDEQKERWLPGIASAEILPAMALTEPDAGSDLKRITTTAEEENGELVLNGKKSFISNVGVCGYYIVLAKELGGYSLVLVPADTSGITTASGPELLIGHVIGEIDFDNVRVPAENRLGAPGKAFHLVLDTLTVFRSSVAGAAVGLAQAALEDALQHAAQREQFGRKLYKIGPVAQLLADSGTEVEAARLLAYKASTKVANGDPDALAYSSMAKVYATEMANRVVARCMQSMGRFSLTKGARIERLYRLVRPMTIYEGASEVLRLGITDYLINSLEQQDK